MSETSDKCNRYLVFDRKSEYEEYIASITKKIAADDTDYSLFNNRGVAYWETGQTQAAMDDFVVSCELVSHDDTPFLNRAELLKEAGDLIRALDFASQAIDISPDNSSGYLVRAGIYEQLGERRHAEEDRRIGKYYNTI